MCLTIVPEKERTLHLYTYIEKDTEFLNFHRKDKEDGNSISYENSTYFLYADRINNF